jgi:hypothetical protein
MPDLHVPTISIALPFYATTTADLFDLPDFQHILQWDHQPEYLDYSGVRLLE